MKLSVYLSRKKYLLKIIFIYTLLFTVLSCSDNQKVYKVGILSGLDYFIETADGFKEKMEELGYIEGKDIIYDCRRTNFEPEKEKVILNEFISEKVDLIVTFPSEISKTAKMMTAGTGIQVVFANANIEGTDLIDNIYSPGGNITGVRFPGPDITIKRLEIMMEVLPEVETFLVGYQEDYPIVDSQLNALEYQIRKSNKRIIKLGANNVSDLKNKLGELEKEESISIGAVLLIAEPLVANPRGFPVIGEYAKKKNIPIGGADICIGEYKSFFSVSTDNRAVGKQAAIIAGKVLKGTLAGSIPVVSAENYIVFNLSAAEEYGIEINEGLLKQADKIKN